MTASNSSRLQSNIVAEAGHSRNRIASPAVRCGARGYAPVLFSLFPAVEIRMELAG
jgi:hypothetical protein